MNIKFRCLRQCLVVAMNLSLAAGCTLQDRDTNKRAAGGLIATPTSHYSTHKARYLGEKYKEHLNRLVERFIGNPRTTNLQFANNLASAGGIGFFTHSAVKVPDERFLEIVLGTSERFEPRGDYSVKVGRLFSLYGRELLILLADDLDLYNDSELSGYGLNFTSRTLGPQPGSERVIIYFRKEKVKAFLKQELDENSLLADAVIFAMEQEGLANLVSFRAPEPSPDVRSPIHEQVLLPELPKPKAGLKALLTNPEANTAQHGDPRPKSQGLLGWESEKERSVIQTDRGSKLKNPAVSVPVNAGMLREQKVETGDRPESVVSDFKANLPVNSDPAHTPAGELGQTRQNSPHAAASVEPITRGKVTQAVVQPETKRENRLNSATIGEPSQKEKDAKSSLDLTASKLPVPLRQSGASEASKLPLTNEKVRTPSPAAMLPSLSQEIKPQSNFVTSQELPAIQKENSKPANIEPPMTALITGSSPEEPSAEAPKQQLTVVATSRTNNLPESKPLVVAIPKALEGYIIQVAFKDRSEARRWGDIFQQRGYAVSTTESGTAESLRVRIGNFSLRDDAERELKSIRKDGLTGIILNLPQAYRPEVHSSLP